MELWDMKLEKKKLQPLFSRDVSSYVESFADKETSDGGKKPAS